MAKLPDKRETDKDENANVHRHADVKVTDTHTLSPEGKDVPTPRQTVKGHSHQVTIQSISGKDVTVTGGKFEDGEVIRIAGRAEVTLNGEKKSLAALDNGDVIVLGNGRKNQDHMNVFEYFKVDATRQDKKKK